MSPPGEGRLTAALVAVSMGLLALRALAATRVGFGDSEALYACYALHPQAAYLDHPGLVGLVARALASGAGAPPPLLVHGITAALATSFPLLVYGAARAGGGGEPASLRGALAAAVVPELAIGLFALTPDLILAFTWTGALGAAAWGLRQEAGSTRAAGAFLTVGVLAGVGASAKVTGLAWFVLLPAALVLGGPMAAGHRRSVWPWLGLLLGALVVAPVVLYEAKRGWPMVHHRFVDTQGDAGLSLRNAGQVILGQLTYLSPVLAVAAAYVVRDLLRRAFRREGSPGQDGDETDAVDVLFAVSLVLPLVVLVPLCLWSRVAEPHWLAPPLLALPLHYARRYDPKAALLSRRLAKAGVVTSLAAVVAVHLWVLVPGLSRVLPPSFDMRQDISTELVGWPQVIDATRAVVGDLQAGDEEAVIVGPHWIVCAQLHAGLPPEIPVGCATPTRDDFDDWLPRDRWLRKSTLVYVTDSRFEATPESLFPLHAAGSTERVTILRAGRPVRTFSITVLRRRSAA